MLLFSLDADPHAGGFARSLAAGLGTELSPHEDRPFEDGEHKLRPLADPRGRDCYVLHALHGGPADSPHDKLMRLLFFAAALREHGAARVTAVLPYLAYARKDRRTQPLDPVTLRYVAQLFEAAGIARVIVLEVHNVAAYENAFRCETLHLEVHRAFDAVAQEWVGERPVAVASPDPGGVKRAQLWRESLEARLGRPVGFAMVDKRRSLGRVSGGSLVAGEVQDATVLLLDDLIASGGTLRGAARALRGAGAAQVLACAAHGLFTSGSAEALADEAIDAVVVSDSVPPFRLPAAGPVRDKLRVVSAVPLFVEAIRACAGAGLTAAR